MNFFQKVFTLRVLLPLTGVLIILGVGTYYYFQVYLPSQEQPPADQNGTEDPTKDWKTYESDGYGFEIKYPQDWDLVIEGEEGAQGFFFISPNQDLSAEEIEEKKNTGYSAIALYRPLFAVLPVGGFGHGLPDSSFIDSKENITLKGRPFTITRYKDGYVFVAETYNANADPDERSPFLIEFYLGEKYPLNPDFFDQMFGTLKFSE